MEYNTVLVSSWLEKMVVLSLMRTFESELEPSKGYISPTDKRVMAGSDRCMFMQHIA